MPRGSGQVIETDVIKNVKEKEVKKEGETAHEPVWTPATGKRFLLQGFIIGPMSTAENRITLEDGTTEIMSVVVSLKGAGTNAVLVQFPVCYQSLAVNNKLQIKTSATNTFTAAFWGTEE